MELLGASLRAGALRLTFLRAQLHPEIFMSAQKFRSLHSDIWQLRGEKIFFVLLPPWTLKENFSAQWNFNKYLYFAHFHSNYISIYLSIYPSVVRS